jgi:hypothetical protein
VGVPCVVLALLSLLPDFKGEPARLARLQRSSA